MSSAGSSAANAANLQNSWQMAQFNAQEAQKNREWQERMSNTAYQRAMADMKQAGLNPILAYQQGGSSTPGGSSASGTAAQFENAMQGLGQGVTSASKGAERALELQQVQSQTGKNVTAAQLDQANTDLSRANTIRANQEALTSASQQRRHDAETALTIEQMENPKAARALMGAQAHSAFEQGNLSREQMKQLQQYGPHWTGQVVGSGERILDRLQRAFQSAPPSAPPKGGYGPDTSSRDLWNKLFGGKK